MKILIVEDEEKLAAALARGLEIKGHIVDVLHDGKSALTRITLHGADYDIVILDLMLPLVSGTEICKAVRENGMTVPIIILTAKDDVESKVDLLLSGADDYMVKPFAFDELLARLHAILRRPQETVAETLSSGEITINTASRTVLKNNTPVLLTLKEYALLEYMIRRPNMVVNREDLLLHLWDFNYDSFSNVVDVHVKNLRKKIDTAGNPSILETIRGIGYRLRG